MKKILLTLCLLLSATLSAQTPADWEGLKRTANFFMANDMGRNGYYDQKPIAETMGRMAEVIGPEGVFAAGD